MDAYLSKKSCFVYSCFANYCMKVYDLLVTQRLRRAAPEATVGQITCTANIIFSQKKKPLSPLNSWELSKRFSVKLIRVSLVVFFFTFVSQAICCWFLKCFYWERNNLVLYVNARSGHSTGRCQALSDAKRWILFNVVIFCTIWPCLKLLSLKS